MTAKIIIIGNEILKGFYPDTNALEISRFCVKKGIGVKEIVISGDNKEDIQNSVKSKKYKYYFISGGLGTTRDDKTKKNIAQILGEKLIYDNSAEKRLKKKLKFRNIEFCDRYKEFCYRLKNSQLIENKNGLAEGIYYKNKESTYIMLPGVPVELKYIIKKLYKKIKTKEKKDNIYGIYGMRESEIEDKLIDLEPFKNGNVSILPSPGIVYLIFRKNNVIERIIKQRLKHNIFTYRGEKIEEAIINRLKEKLWKLSVAESCTGGYLGKLITDIPGSSKIFTGGIISYSNEIKANLLKVNKNILKRKGAVSKEVSILMAEGVRKLMDTDLGVAITGIAGPEGGTEEKPVGTVWISVSGKNRIISNKYLFAGNREQIRYRASRTALILLYESIR